MNDLRKLRAQNLKRLIDERYQGKQIRLARATDVHPSYISSMLSILRGVEDAKPLTEDMADKIERALGLRPGDLSTDPEARHGPEPRPEAAMNEALLELLETQSARMGAMRDSVEKLRDQAISNAAIIEVLCSALVERDAALAPVIKRVMEQALSLSEGVDSLAAFEAQAQSLAKHVSGDPRVLEAAVPKTVLRPGPGRH